MLDMASTDLDFREACELQSVAEQAVGAGWWSLDIASGREYRSPGLYRLLGLTPDKISPDVVAWQSVLRPVDADEAGGLIRQSIDGHKPFMATYRIVLPDSGIRWIEVNGQADYDRLGNPVRFSGYCLDVTGRKQSGEEYREIKERQSFLSRRAGCWASISRSIACSMRRQTNPA